MLKSLKTLLDGFDRLNRRRGLIRKGDRILVGLSGGPDSTALLNVLCVLRRKYSLNLAGAHVNHGLHPKQNLAHERLARASCSALGVPLHVRRIRLKAIAKKNHLSIEEAGREERYAFFQTIAVKERCNRVATAHTLDDQAETVLLRLLRGSGPRGMAGIPPIRPLGNLKVIRPFLNASKADLLRFLIDEGIRFGHDRSNGSRDFTRNRVRYDLLPLLRKAYNPKISESLATLAAASFDASEHLKVCEKKASDRVARKIVRRVSIDLKKWRSLDSAMRSETFFSAIEALRGNRRGIDASHLDGLFRIADAKEKKLRTELPGGVTVKRAGEALIFIS